MARVRFADKEHVECLHGFGFCAFRVSKEDRAANHPDIGDVITLLIDDSDRGRRVAVRLIADQEQEEGACISIYAAAISVFKREGLE